MGGIRNTGKLMNKLAVCNCLMLFLIVGLSIIPTAAVFAVCW